jgi:dephospho-CoA kinase
MKRNKLSLEEAQQRINSQMPLADKIAKATYIIDNSTDIETTRKQVKDIHNKLKQSNPSSSCSTSGTRHVTFVTNTVISHK